MATVQADQPVRLVGMPGAASREPATGYARLEMLMTARKPKWTVKIKGKDISVSLSNTLKIQRNEYVRDLLPIVEARQLNFLNSFEDEINEAIAREFSKPAHRQIIAEKGPYDD
jgi:hypothetical protein